eukprot:TRINITY_DN7307_c0_g1_i2.p1 TRINITY_DN7307_c0_g1~~TRINITY_DN7307_c0_g1_i2.p1  ORF type:complete len:507 (+),score=111.56 TRINITY_DN7307_c0_g1_i2:96-1616(+)
MDRLGNGDHHESLIDPDEAISDPRITLTTNPKEWTELDVSSTGLRVLSSLLGWAHYSHITILHLNNNKFTTIPAELFRHLIHLTALNLSSNQLVSLPPTIGQLSQLQKLLLQNNHLEALPAELGKLRHLKELGVDNNPLRSPPPAIVSQGTQSCLEWLRERIHTSPHQRHFISGPDFTASGEKFRVLSYNILGDLYATTDAFPYCPPQALAWKYRRSKLLNEIQHYDCDVICLQEVPMKHYNKFFLPAMQASGYMGIFLPKSRARTMSDYLSVDGCVIFYRTSKFTLVEQHTCEFQSIAMSKHKDFNQDQEAFNRVITRDNVALLAILQVVDHTNAQPRFILVGNTHIHWNTEQKDVKLIQVMMMLEQIATMTSPTAYRGIPMVIAGDFNSVPGSGPYQLLKTATIPPRHADLHPYHYGAYSSHGMKHPFHLSSAYGFMGEPPFTNTSTQFVGTLDYLWFTHETLKVSKVLQPIEEEIIKVTLMPNLHVPSDHICIASEFCFQKPR